MGPIFKSIFSDFNRASLTKSHASNLIFVAAIVLRPTYNATTATTACPKQLLPIPWAIKSELSVKNGGRLFGRIRTHLIIRILGSMD